MSELDLEKLRLKDEQALQALFTNLYATLRPISRNLVRNYDLTDIDPIELVNETILKFYRNLGSFLEQHGEHAQEKVKPYAFAIMKNLAFTMLRDQRRANLARIDLNYSVDACDDPELSPISTPIEAISVEERISSSEHLEEFRRQISDVRIKLTDSERAVLDGLLADLDIDQIAKQLGVTPGYVHTMKSRLTRRLRALLMVPTAKRITSSGGR